MSPEEFGWVVESNVYIDIYFERERDVIRELASHLCRGYTLSNMKPELHVPSHECHDPGVATARNAPFSGPFGASQIPESVTKIEAAMRDLMEDWRDDEGWCFEYIKWVRVWLVRSSPGRCCWNVRVLKALSNVRPDSQCFALRWKAPKPSRVLGWSLWFYGIFWKSQVQVSVSIRNWKRI